MDSNTTDIEKSEHPLMPSKPADPVSEIATTATLLDEQNNDKEQVENETQPKVPRKRSLHFWKLLVSSLTVVAVLQLAGLLVLTVAWRNKRNQALLPREQTLCVPCNVIQDASDTISENFDIKPDASTNVTICCNSVSTVLRLLINKQTAEQFYDGYASRMFSENADCPNIQKSKPAAMLAGIALEMVNENIVHWKRTNIVEEHKEHIQHHNGKLSIKQEGYYFVYSQLKWKFRHDITNNTKNDTEPVTVVIGNDYSHTVHLESRSSPILEGLKTSCDFEFQRFEATSPLGAVFFLNKDETISVKTSHPQHLVSSHHSNFFGLYKL